MNVDRNEALLKKWTTGPDYPFPPQPMWPQCFGGYELLPIETCAQLYEESLNMRHCAGAWAQIVSEGHYVALSIRRGGCRIATAMVEIGTTRVGHFGPPLVVRGYKNEAAPQLEAVIREWLDSRARHLQ